MFIQDTNTTYPSRHDDRTAQTSHPSLSPTLTNPSLQWKVLRLPCPRPDVDVVAGRRLSQREVINSSSRLVKRCTSASGRLRGVINIDKFIKLGFLTCFIIHFVWESRTDFARRLTFLHTRGKNRLSSCVRFITACKYKPHRPVSGFG